MPFSYNWLLDFHEYLNSTIILMDFYLVLVNVWDEILKYTFCVNEFALCQGLSLDGWIHRMMCYQLSHPCLLQFKFICKQ